MLPSEIEEAKAYEKLRYEMEEQDFYEQEEEKAPKKHVNLSDS
jgi:hypothetical protein